MKKRKILYLILMLTAIFNSACVHQSASNVLRYQVGDYAVYIADKNTVNREWMKIPEKGKQHAASEIDGYINYKDKEIWSIESIATLVHEFKHMLEGDFHAPGGKLRAEVVENPGARTAKQDRPGNTGRPAAAFQSK